MKRKITITIDESLYKALRLDSKNVSGFINELLEAKLVGTYQEQFVTRLTRQVKDALTADEIFFAELKERLRYN